MICGHAEGGQEFFAEDLPRVNGWEPIAVSHFRIASLMIVDDLDLIRRAFAPSKANSPLVVDPDAVLALPVAAQSFEPISWHGSQILQHFGVIQHAQLSPRHRGNIGEFAMFAVKKLFSLLAPERAYQMGSIPRQPLNIEP
jgi:hypothetical protein